MNISYNWLKDYITFDLDPNGLAEILTSTGLEVGGVSKVESIKGGLHGVVAGRVETCEKHPNADKLSVCTVDIGEAAPLNIVCGAPNVAAGQMVWVATVGTTLYPTGSDDPFKIGKAKVRGEVSVGMICAEDELGLGQGHDGIMVLDDGVAIGTLATKYYDVKVDHVLDIDLTPNRSDATSHVGVARDLGAYLKVNGNADVAMSIPDTTIDLPSGTNDFQVQVENAEGCPRYSGLVIDGISIGPSPEWMQARLTAIGVRPINNVVDITNYVLHELGQPLHAFDAALIKDRTIVVKTLAEGTPFVTLDEIERKLTSEDLMICNGAGEGMCIAGVFGGLGTGVTEKTTSIFLESAHFDPEWIRKSSLHHQLRTDAARTFEKTTDPNICVKALMRAAGLIQELAGGQVVSSVMDIYPEPVEPVEVTLRWSQIDKVTGIAISHEEILNILRAQSMTILSSDENGFVVAVPTDKADVTREADVIEEILRIYGYDNVHLHAKMEVGLSAVSGVTRHQMRNILGSFLSAQGFSEMMGLSLTEDKNLETGAFPVDESKTVLIQNTSNVSMNTLRPDLMVTALEAVRYNQNRSQESFRFFEFGHGYTKGTEKNEETEYISIVMVGKEWPDNWTANGGSDVDYFTLKKYVDAILGRVNMKRVKSTVVEDNRFAESTAYASAGKDVVTFGKVSKKLTEQFDIRFDVYYAQFQFNMLFEALGNNRIISSEVSKFPAMKRDLAFILDESVTYEKLAKLVKQNGGNLITDLDLFDVYRNPEHVGEGKKSYAIQMTFENPSRTLTDSEVDDVIKRIVGKVEQDLGGKLRG